MPVASQTPAFALQEVGKTETGSCADGSCEPYSADPKICRKINLRNKF